MQLRDDVVADRETETGPLAGRLCREERLEELVPDLRGNAGAVVADPHFDHVAEIARRHFEGGLEIRLAPFALSLPCGIEPVAAEVEEDARHVLRRDLDRFEGGVESVCNAILKV